MAINFKILLIEDNPSERELTLRILKKSGGYDSETKVFKDGSDILEFVNSAEFPTELDKLPKVIFLDLLLPKISGIEVTRKIRKSEKMKTIPIVGISSLEQKSRIQEAYEAGINSYILKQGSYEEYKKQLYSEVNYWLNLNQPINL